VRDVRLYSTMFQTRPYIVCISGESRAMSAVRRNDLVPRTRTRTGALRADRLISSRVKRKPCRRPLVRVYVYTYSARLTARRNGGRSLLCVQGAPRQQTRFDMSCLSVCSGNGLGGRRFDQLSATRR